MQAEGNQVQLVMGAQEASVIGTALGALLGSLNEGIEDHEDTDESTQNEFMAMLSVKMCAEHMFTSIWSMLGMSDESVAMLLRGTESREGGLF
jgi:hypothetical protein